MINEFWRLWRRQWFKRTVISVAVIVVALSLKAWSVYQAPNEPAPGSTQALLVELDEQGHKWQKETQPVSQLFADLQDGKVEGVVLGQTRVYVKTQAGQRYSVSDAKGLVSERLVNEFAKEGSAPFPLTSVPLSGFDLGRLVGIVFNTLLVGLIAYMVIPLLKTLLPFDVHRGGTDLTFNDVVGCHGAKEALLDIIQASEMRRAYRDAGARPPKGVLLVGPPGVGKTQLAKALATECGMNFISATGSDFTKSIVGQGVMTVRQLFNTARRNTPCIVFIDEMDGIGKRTQGGDAVATENNRIINRMLVEMDGFSSTEGIYVIGATNFIGSVDPAMLREGRFDRIVEIAPPNNDERLELLELYTGKLNNLGLMNLDDVSRRCIGLTPAAIAAVVNLAAVRSVRAGSRTITQEHLLQAIETHRIGEVRVGAYAMTDEVRRRVSIHEAGHAVANVLLGLGQLEKVSLLPRGQALGVTLVTPAEDRRLVTRTQLEREMQMLLAGRVAERIVLGDESSGAADDLHRATEIAIAMAAEFGMAGMGQMASARALRAASIPLSAEQMVKSANRLLEAADCACEKMLVEIKPALLQIAESLNEKEEILGEEVEGILALVQRSPASEQGLQLAVNKG